MKYCWNKLIVFVNDGWEDLRTEARELSGVEVFAGSGTGRTVEQERPPCKMDVDCSFACPSGGFCNDHLGTCDCLLLINHILSSFHYFNYRIYTSLLQTLICISKLIIIYHANETLSEKSLVNAKSNIFHDNLLLFYNYIFHDDLDLEAMVSSCSFLLSSLSIITMDSSIYASSKPKFSNSPHQLHASWF